MKVLWVHNFDKKKNINSGVFMYDQLARLKDNDLDVELFCLNRHSLLQTLKDFISLYKKANQYDLIHAQYGSFVGYFTSFLPAKKIISLRGTDYYGVPKTSLKKRIFNVFSRFFTFNSLKRYDLIITMSDRMTNGVKAKFPNKKIVTLTDGIQLERFVKTIAPKADKSTLKILFSSIHSDNPVKRAYLATGAIELLKKDNFDVELVPMTGVKHADVPNFISKCDMVLLTSTHEGWPNVIKECLALNIPFVSTDVSDLGTIAAVENSCFVTEPVSEKLAEAIIRVISIPDKDNLNLRKYVEHMGMEHFANDLIDIYRSA